MATNLNKLSHTLARKRVWLALCSLFVATTAHAQFALPSFGSTGPATAGSIGGSSGAGATASGTQLGNGSTGLSANGTPTAAGAAQQQGQQLQGQQGQQGPQQGNALDNNARSLARDRVSGTNDAAAREAPNPDVGTAGGGRQGRPVAPPSQFQQFVQQATGRLLPVYGADLFSAPQATFVPDGAAPAPADYTLGPGDEVRLQVWGGVDYDGSLTVDRNGQVTIPRAGTVNLAGVKVRDVETALRSQLGKTFTNFNLNANLGRLRTIQVYVVGQAQQPGTYNLSSLSTLVNALFASGGPNANGSMRNIELKRGGRRVTTIDLYNFIGSGDNKGDVSLQPGDVIVIPPVGPRMALNGAVDQAAIYELKPGESTLGSVLGLSGGVPTLATTSKALLERVVPGQNPPRQVQDIALNAAGLQQPLRDGDIVTLLAISPAFANAVTLQGNVAAPLRYRWFPGMRLRDLLPERDALITADYYQRKNLLVQAVETDASKAAGASLTGRVRGMVDQINWDYAVIERLDREQLRTQLIPFNLGRMLQGDDTQNLQLQQGDVVTILSQKDLQLPVLRQTRLVRLEGEVAAAGMYEVRPGETLRQLIERVGGLTPQAYVFGTAVDRESVRKKQQENLEQLIRRLESQQQSQILFQVANRPTTDAGGQAAILQQQQALARSQLDSLRKLRSDGRISLELDPQQQTIAALPDLPLEDGDRVVVPATPGFIAAVGAVNNENVFIHKPGRTVADVARSAGLREEADTDLMFVLRADGSIVSRRDSRRGFFGGGFDGLVLMPGDTLVIPEKLDRETTRNFIARQLKDYTQILSQFGLGVAAIKVIRDL